MGTKVEKRPSPPIAIHYRPDNGTPTTDFTRLPVSYSGMKVQGSDGPSMDNYRVGPAEIPSQIGNIDTFTGAVKGSDGGSMIEVFSAAEIQSIQKPAVLGSDGDSIGDYLPAILPTADTGSNHEEKKVKHKKGKIATVIVSLGSAAAVVSSLGCGVPAVYPFNVSNAYCYSHGGKDAWTKGPTDFWDKDDYATSRQWNNFRRVPGDMHFCDGGPAVTYNGSPFPTGRIPALPSGRWVIGVPQPGDGDNPRGYVTGNQSV